MKVKKIIMIIVLILAIISVAIFGYLYYYTDLFKSNKSLFLKSLSNIKIIDNDIIQKYSGLTENINNSNYSSTGDINCSIVENNNETSIDNIQKLFTLKYNTLKNRNFNQDYADLTLNLNNEDIATARYIKDNNVYGLKLENVLRKYLAVENNNLKSFFSKLGVKNIDNIPDTILYSDIKELYNLSEEEYNKIINIYGNIIIDNIDDSKFTKERNSDNTVTLKLSLTEKELATIIIKELYTLKNDEDMLNLVINKAMKLGYNYNIDSLKTAIQEEIDNINNNTNITNNELISISIMQSNNKAIRIDINLRIETSDTDINNNLKLALDLSQSNKITAYYKDNENSIKLDISYGYEENTISTNIEAFLLDDQNNVTKDLFKVIYQINAYNENSIGQNSVITYYSEGNNRIQLELKDSKELKQDIQIEKLTNENMELLNNKSKDELDKLFKAILERIVYVYGDKLGDYSLLLENIL